MKTKAVAPIVVLIAIVLLGGGALGVSKTKWFNGDTKRAKEATKTTENLIAVTDNQGGAAAAYVATIASVNNSAPDSPQKNAIAGLAPIALSYLPAPDPNKLLEAEKLKNAYLEGRLDLQASLTASALTDAANERKEKVKAIAAVRSITAELSQVAAERLGAEQQRFWLALVALAAGALYVWTKLSHVSPLSLSRAIQDIRTGGEQNPTIAAIDGAITPFQQANVALTAWFRTKLGKLFQ